MFQGQRTLLSRFFSARPLRALLPLSDTTALCAPPSCASGIKSSEDTCLLADRRASTWEKPIEAEARRRRKRRWRRVPREKPTATRGELAPVGRRVAPGEELGGRASSARPLGHSCVRGRAALASLAELRRERVAAGARRQAAAEIHTSQGNSSFRVRHKVAICVLSNSLLQIIFQSFLLPPILILIPIPA